MIKVNDMKLKTPTAIYLFLLSPILCVAQNYKDHIVTNLQDTIRCQITLVNDQNIFFNHRPKKAEVNDHMGLDEIQEYSWQGQLVDFSEIPIEHFDPPEYEGVQWEYCELVGSTWITGITKITIELDCGNKEAAFDDMRMRDKNGKLLKFQTMVEALNYFGTQGWEVIDAYPVSTGSQLVYHYLIKREIK